MTLFPRVLEQLKERGAEHVVLFGGGIIPDADVVTLKEMGVAEIFTPGAPLATITDWLADTLDQKENA
jgi:methylmalonyl-CoA mutase C-terminal domain/subunit